MPVDLSASIFNGTFDVPVTYKGKVVRAIISEGSNPDEFKTAMGNMSKVLLQVSEVPDRPKIHEKILTEDGTSLDITTIDRTNAGTWRIEALSKVRTRMRG
jgi:hypothetical protein